MSKFPNPKVVREKLNNDAHAVVAHLAGQVFNNVDQELTITISRAALNQCKFFDDWIGCTFHYIWLKVVEELREEGWSIEKKENQLIISPIKGE